MPKDLWLKKYTKLEHLEKTLRHLQLHLGSPKKWPDKNDSECIRVYSRSLGEFEMLATCLTKAADRFHFWHVFGECEKGVCLWFDRSSLLNDIRSDPSLVAENVCYRTPQELKQIEPNLLPFAKRKQYHDECEFRVLRVKAVKNIPADKFAFSACSLKRIYLNPWLSSKAVQMEKSKISEMLESKLQHVNVFQNRSLKQKAWFDAASYVARVNRKTINPR